MMEMMTMEELKNEGVKNQLARVKAQFKEAVKKARTGHYQETLALSEEVVGQLINVVHQIGLDYRQEFISHKAPHLTEIKEFIAGKHETPIKKEEIFDFLFKIDTTVNTVQSEIKAIYSPSRWTTRWFWPLLSLILILSLISSVAVRDPEKKGLVGLYYHDQKFRGPYQKRVDKVIDFNWKKGSPLKKFNRDKFCVRWTGFLRVPENGIYNFSVVVDDHAKVWLGQTAILSVNNRRRHKDTALTILKEGYYPIRVEYVERTSQANIKFAWRWSGWNQEQVVSASYLTPSVETLKRNSTVHDEKVELLFQSEERR